MFVRSLIFDQADALFGKRSGLKNVTISNAILEFSLEVSSFARTAACAGHLLVLFGTSGGNHLIF